MARKESFLLVSLSEDKAKELAQVVSNDTSRKILDYLADRDGTETEIAKELNLPISTVHYNLQQLMKGSLVTVEEFHYSEKGKEVNHYKLANKYIIIAPKTTWGLKEKLRKILPVAAITLCVAAIIEVITKYVRFPFIAASKAAPMMEARVGADEAVLARAPEAIQSVAQQPSIWQYAALWFLVGGFAAILLYLLIDWIREK